jgi:hypothetical protein
MMATNPSLADLQPLVSDWKMGLLSAVFLPDRKRPSERKRGADEFGGRQPSYEYGRGGRT